MRMKLTTARGKNWANLFRNLPLSPPDWSAQIQFFAVLMRHKISWEICETLCHKFAKLNFAEHRIVFFISLSFTLYYFFVDSYFELKLMQSDLKDYWLPYSCCCHCRSLTRWKLFLFMRFSIWYDMRGVVDFYKKRSSQALSSSQGNISRLKLIFNQSIDSRKIWHQFLLIFILHFASLMSNIISLAAAAAVAYHHLAINQITAKKLRMQIFI